MNNSEGSVPKQNDPATNDQSNSKNQPTADRRSIIGAILFYLILGVFIAWNSETVREFLLRNLWPIAIAITLLAIFLLNSFVREKNTIASTRRKIAFVIYIAIPILLILAVAIFIMPQYHSIILRSFFLLIVCLLPATLYYLFIVSSKTSLLHEFFTNLSRLGLLDSQNRGGKQESELERRVRIMSYLEKFEAVYGSIPDELKDEIIEASHPDNTDSAHPAFDKYTTDKMLGGIFTPATTIPVVLATLLIGLGWLLTLPPWELIDGQHSQIILDDLAQVLHPETTTVNFAFLGAYFFSLQMLFRRYIRKDLRGSAYTSASIRIILAVIGIWAVIQTAPYLNLTSSFETDVPMMLVIAFVIGAFPPIIWQIIQSAFRFITGARFFVPSLRSEMPVSGLDGLTVWHEARLEEEDIENIPNMSTANIVELLLQTRIPPERIIDWVDQAILYTQIGSENNKEKKFKSAAGQNGDSSSFINRTALRQLGIRTASDLVVAVERPIQTNGNGQNRSVSDIDMQLRLHNLANILKTYPNLRLVMTWRSLENSE